MNKTLLRLLVYELLERTAHYRALLGEVQLSPQLSKTIQRALNEVSVDLLERPVEATGPAAEQVSAKLAGQTLSQLLYAEHPIADADCIQLLKRFIVAPYQALTELTQPLSALMPGTVRPETQFFLSDLTLTDSSAARSLEAQISLELLCGPENTQAMPKTDRWGYTPLSVLQKNAPLGWVALASSWAHQLIANTGRYGVGSKSIIESLKNYLPVTVPMEALEEIAIGCLALRRVGPAYYFQVVLDALLKQDTTVLYWVEPVMFMAMNHASLTDKSLVILHEVAETARQLYGQLIPQGSGTHAAERGTKMGSGIGWVQNGWLENWLVELENLIPTKSAFNEKHLERTLHIQERLNNGILMSSLSRYPLDEMLPEILQALPTELSFGLQQSVDLYGGQLKNFPDRDSDLEDFPEPKGIYEVLERVAEYPNSPREIVNAGWLHKMHNSALVLYRILQNPNPAKNEPDTPGLETLMETQFNSIILHIDQLLLKSIETSEIHKGLLQLHPLAPTPVGQ